jgi:pimeloyl-ACP methyl ester carboxylesterase
MEAMMLLSRREAMAGGALLVPTLTLAQERPKTLAFSVPVPLDHDRPKLGSLALQCEWGSPPAPGRPTIVAVADGQQYFTRPGGAARLQKELFGTELNLLTIVGRSRSEEIARLVMKPERTDWGHGYRLLKWTQWARDLGSVIRQLGLGKHGLGLYGRSGGARLILEYLTLYPETRARVYVQAAVNQELDVRWGVGGDRFWEEFATAESDLARDLLAWLPQHPQYRRNLILVLQRQHFFEKIESLPEARATAVRAFLRGDGAAIGEMRERYQIAAIEQMRSTLEGVGSTSRVYEFASARKDPRATAGPLSPTHEAEFYYAEPLSNAPYRPPVPAVDWSKLRDQRAEVLLVSGRHDHVCDYRTQIGLNGLTRGSKLLILDDDHVFKRWTAAGSQARFLQTYFLKGAGSPGFTREVAALGELLWSEDS